MTTKRQAVRKEKALNEKERKLALRRKQRIQKLRYQGYFPMIAMCMMLCCSMV